MNYTHLPCLFHELHTSIMFTHHELTHQPCLLSMFTQPCLLIMNYTHLLCFLFELHTSTMFALHELHTSSMFTSP